jgi:hypothetical protein
MSSVGTRDRSRTWRSACFPLKSCKNLHSGRAPAPRRRRLSEGQGTGNVQGNPGRPAHEQNRGLLMAKGLPVALSLKIEAFSEGRRSVSSRVWHGVVPAAGSCAGIVHLTTYGRPWFCQSRAGSKGQGWVGNPTSPDSLQVFLLLLRSIVTFYFFFFLRTGFLAAGAFLPTTWRPPISESESVALNGY